MVSSTGNQSECPNSPAGRSGEVLDCILVPAVLAFHVWTSCNGVVYRYKVRASPDTSLAQYQNCLLICLGTLDRNQFVLFSHQKGCSAPSPLPSFGNTTKFPIKPILGNKYHSIKKS